MRSSTFIAGVLMVTSLIVPAIGTAQTASTTETAIAADPAIDTTVDPSIPLTISTSTDEVIVQETIPGDVLETTIDPNTETATTTATTTEPVVTDNSQEGDQPVEAPAETPVQDEIVPDPSVEVVAVIPGEQLKPKAKFMFSIGAQKIPAKKVPDYDKGSKAKQSAVTDAPALTPDNTDGSLVVSGACAAKFYVVLLYKNANDYDTNPRSYILNKAYECQNGHYTYDIKDLPDGIADGTYYLLVAEMSESDSWQPISAVVPINISKN